MYRLYTDYIPIIYRLYTDYIPIIYRLYTDYIPIIYRLYTDYIPIIYLDVLIANILDCVGYLFPEFTEVDLARQCVVITTFTASLAFSSWHHARSVECNRYKIGQFICLDLLLPLLNLCFGGRFDSVAAGSRVCTFLNKAL